MKYEVRVKFHKDFIRVEGNKIIAGVMARPEKGKANEGLIGKIARHFKVPSSKVNIVSGARSKKKIVEID